MSTEEIDEALEDIFLDVVPDADWNALKPDESYRDRFGMDSMDFLNVVELVAERLAVAIPEKDYTAVETHAGLVAYISDHRP
jgi:acyl carrier protein